MKQFFLKLIQFKNQRSRSGIDQQMVEPVTADKVQQKKSDSLFRPTSVFLDRDALRLYKAMDLAG